MQSRSVCIAVQAISYIEENLEEDLSLGQIAQELHYSKYHLHRTFKKTVGLPLHKYIVRRQLTEAARELVYSKKTIMEIALMSGYESQQAFTDVFRALYKAAPSKFRESGRFYPLQLPVHLGAWPVRRKFTEQDIVWANVSDADGCLELARLKIDGYPCLDEAEYMENLRNYMDDNRAVILRDGDMPAGVMAFSETGKGMGSIDFLAVHPLYRELGVEKLFLSKLSREIFRGREISVTTYRAGDRADTGYRESYRRLGFEERELLFEYGYPTQRFVLPPD